MNPPSPVPALQPDSDLQNNHNTTMKTPIHIKKTLIHAAIVLITNAVASTSRADGLTASGDFDNDGLVDIAEVTSSTTVTVYLVNPDGSYTVSAILSAPKNKKITYVQVFDFNGDGALDVIANGPVSGGWYTSYILLGNGDGTFGSMITRRWAWPPKGNHGSW
jgi:hypothetical protein